jgi:formylglycine-generating enzyme required for sulfatase activity
VKTARDLTRFVLALACASSLVLAACGGAREKPPLGQILLYVDTDAPLPAAPGDVLSPIDPPPLFDRVRIEVYSPGENAPCAGCTHEFDLDRTLVSTRRASVGITLPTATPGWTARVRIFSTEFAQGSEPRADATLESTVALPATDAEGIVPVTVMLSTEDVAKPRGTIAAPIAPIAGAPGDYGGVWPGAIRVDCADPPRDGEVCVPGGAYWMGTAALGDIGPSAGMRVVSLSPFYMDATEMTVASLRAAGVALAGTKGPSTYDPMLFDPGDGSPGPIMHCTYTQSAGSDETLPVNCVSRHTARRACQAKGADLPTEAQFHYASGALSSRVFVWGKDVPACNDACYFRAVVDSPDQRCPGEWVAEPGSGTRDRLVLPTGTIVDLAGNLAEHTLDMFNLDNEPCWGTGVFHDPVCTTPSPMAGLSATYTVVGGSWVDGVVSLSSASRQPGASFAMAQLKGPAGGLEASSIVSVGFRCARPATPKN